MKVIIDISKDVYEECQGHIYFPDTGGELFDAVKNATPLDGMTNGEMIRALFPKAEVYVQEWKDFKSIVVWFENAQVSHDFTWDWWNAPYQKKREE